MIKGALNDHWILVCRNDHDRNTGVTFAQVYQAGKTAYTRHVQIQQNQVDILVLIDQFLQFTQDLGDGRPVELDLGQVLEAHAADLRREGTDVELNSCDPCPYRADPVALDRLLVNLMENAAHYGRGSMVNIDLRCDGSGVLIEIGDRGPGIPSDQAEAVFRPFHRLESARGSRTGGSGLGLAIARQLADKHNWSVELLPRDGGGTVAKVVLPIV